jgi:predicted nucleic acid-binding protein
VTIVAVADTGPLIHLDEVDALELLSLLDRLYVPETVYEELAVGTLPAGLDALEYTLQAPDGATAAELNLDPGETAAIALAAEHEAVVLTDDLTAREAATDRGIDVQGTVGVIALGHGRGELDRDAAASLLRSLQTETSLFVADAVIERGIEMLDRQ